MGELLALIQLPSSDLVTTLRDAGVAIAVLAIMGWIVIRIIGVIGMLLSSGVKSEGTKWSDFMDMWKKNLDLQEKQLNQMHNFQRELSELDAATAARTTEAVAIFNKRFDEIDSTLAKVMIDINQIKTHFMGIDDTAEG